MIIAIVVVLFVIVLLISYIVYYRSKSNSKFKNFKELSEYLSRDEGSKTANDGRIMNFHYSDVDDYNVTPDGQRKEFLPTMETDNPIGLSGHASFSNTSFVVPMTQYSGEVFDASGAYDEWTQPTAWLKDPSALVVTPGTTTGSVKNDLLRKSPSILSVNSGGEAMSPRLSNASTSSNTSNPNGVTNRVARSDSAKMTPLATSRRAVIKEGTRSAPRKKSFIDMVAENDD
jgi:hypothetical protein